MSAGLLSTKNLSESGLNSKEALQKLYEPQIQNDILLFAFASRLESDVFSSKNINEPNQITGFINEPISDSQGNISLRTKFSSLNYTFSDNNSVWLDKIPSSMDQRSISDLTSGIGCPVRVSVSGSIVAVSIQSQGNNYTVKDSSGNNISLPATVNVRVRGRESESESAVVAVTVDNNSISASSPLTIITPGSGYIDNEILELIPACGPDDIPSEDKCLNYTGNSLHFNYFSSGQPSTPATLKNEKYTYRVRFSSFEGFFLYDDRVNKYMYLGAEYDSFKPISESNPPSLTLKRYDFLSSDNLVQLYYLNGISTFYGYGGWFASDSSIGGSIRNLTNKVDEIRDSFKYIIQSNRKPRNEFNPDNNLGTRYNIIDGRSIISNYRVVFRDPESVLDQSNVDFFELSSLSQPDQTSLTLPNNSSVFVPGIWLWAGDKYQRIFSTDDKPFMSLEGKKYLSPAIYSIGGTGELNDNGANKYSISASYYKPGNLLNNSSIRGFNTTITTLIQNLSDSANNGGFVYHRTLITTAVPSAANLTYWPLFSYKENNIIKDAEIVATV